MASQNPFPTVRPLENDAFGYLINFNDEIRMNPEWYKFPEKTKEELLDLISSKTHHTGGIIDGKPRLQPRMGQS